MTNPIVVGSKVKHHDVPDLIGKVVELGMFDNDPGDPNVEPFPVCYINWTTVPPGEKKYRGMEQPCHLTLIS